MNGFDIVCEGSEHVIIEFATDASQHEHFRQLSIVLLSQHVQRCWKEFQPSVRYDIVSFALQSSQAFYGILQKSAVSHILM